MATETVNCNGCGAELQVATTTRFVTCNRCGAQLAIQRTAEATYTEFKGDSPGGNVAQVLADPWSSDPYSSPSPPPPERPAQPELAGYLGELTYQQELARIDREWDIEREQYMITDRWGRQHIPDAKNAEIMGHVGKGSLVGGLVTAGFGVLWTIFAIQLTRDAPFPMVGIIFPLFGVLFILFGLGSSIGFSRMVGKMQENYREKAEQYQQAYQAHQQRRQDFLRRHGGA